jgi:hypothetical protein
MKSRRKMVSETEHHAGKLIPVELTGSIEETCKKILQGMGVAPEDYYSSFRDQLDDEGYRQYFITDDAIYKIESESLDASDDIARATKNADGSIDFEVRYYNGGASFSEMLTNAMKKI